MSFHLTERARTRQSSRNLGGRNRCSIEYRRRVEGYAAVTPSVKYARLTHSWNRYRRYQKCLQASNPTSICKSVRQIIFLKIDTSYNVVVRYPFSDFVRLKNFKKHWKCRNARWRIIRFKTDKYTFTIYIFNFNQFELRRKLNDSLIFCSIVERRNDRTKGKRRGDEPFHGSERERSPIVFLSSPPLHSRYTEFVILIISLVEILGIYKGDTEWKVNWSTSPF